MNLHPLLCAGDEELRVDQLCKYLDFGYMFIDVSDEYAEFEDNHDSLHSVEKEFIEAYTPDKMGDGWLDGGCFVAETGDIYNVQVKPMHQIARALYDHFLAEGES